MRRTFLMGLGSLAGSIVVRVVRAWWRGDDTPESDEDSSSDGLAWTEMAAGPTSVFAAIGIARSASDRLDLEDDDRFGHFLLGAAIGGALTLLAEPIARLRAN